MTRGPLAEAASDIGGATSSELRAATRAVYTVFIGSGFAFASWASRIPQVRDRLHLDPRQLGLVLLAIAAGSIIAMPLAGMVVTRLGAARSVAVMSCVLVVGLAGAAFGYRYGVEQVVAGLFFVGFGNGTWDVAMNVEAAEVERRSGRPIMPKFHAGFSIGTVGGAALGSLMVAAHVGVTPHLFGVAVLVALAVPTATRAFVGVRRETPPDKRSETPSRHPLHAWTEPRTLLVGVFVLCLAFTEGTGNDWLGVAMIDGYHVPAALGSFTFAVFVAAMTTGRWFGPRAIDRYGRVPVLRRSAVLALCGLLLVVFAGSYPVAVAGTVMWGLGAALGFPVGMSAAADEPEHAPGRVSVVASIGYVAFLAGPPTIGFLGNHVGVLRSLVAVVAALAVAALVATACRPLGHEA